MWYGAISRTPPPFFNLSNNRKSSQFLFCLALFCFCEESLTGKKLLQFCQMGLN